MTAFRGIGETAVHGGSLLLFRRLPLLLRPHSCACHRNPASPSPWADETFRAADAALLDPCDKYRDEGGKVCAKPVTRRSRAVR
ncbi:hypothetical protein FKV68_12750 [Sinorhizobium mexicanum]|uniref:Uncharacterized protein n=1 Tax=Sinorhizobium mexicanum TaxID=375549 RepID=A0A859QL17_9HYPH|nr:hypothetical protein FKV68_12750 [Sinorhizobium mexicanum]